MKHTVQKISNLLGKGVQTLGKQMTEAGQTIEKSGKNLSDKTELIRPTIPPITDAFKKREYAQEEMYIREKEREQRELEKAAKKRKEEKEEK